MILSYEGQYVLEVKGVDAFWSALTEEGLVAVMTEYTKDNHSWIYSDCEVTEILEVDLDLVKSHNQMLTYYLCTECATNECESNGEAHLDITHNVTIRHVNVIRDRNRNN